jgi:hypothetical protein
MKPYTSSSKQISEVLRNDVTKWGQVVKAANIPLD